MSATPSIPELGFVVFYVSDLDASYAYFTEKLGFKAVPGQNGPVFRFLGGSDEKIGYGLNIVSEETPPAGTAELYFKTDDVAGLHTVMSAAGAETTSITQFPFGSVFNVRTPDRHALLMWQEPAQ